MAYIFNGKFLGLADSKYSGYEGSFYRCVRNLPKIAEPPWTLWHKWLWPLQMAIASGSVLPLAKYTLATLAALGVWLILRRPAQAPMDAPGP